MLTETEIAVGAIFASQAATHRALVAEQEKCLHAVEGSRLKTFSYVCAKELKEAHEALEAASRKACDALARQRRLEE
jgi:hypothetical protein